jgi:hypothetical protein
MTRFAPSEVNDCAAAPVAVGTTPAGSRLFGLVARLLLPRARARCKAPFGPCPAGAFCQRQEVLGSAPIASTAAWRHLRIDPRELRRRRRGDHHLHNS